jgi:hypothetical protein
MGQPAPVATTALPPTDEALLLDLNDLPLPEFFFSEEPAQKAASVLVVRAPKCPTCSHVLRVLLFPLAHCWFPHNCVAYHLK